VTTATPYPPVYPTDKDQLCMVEWAECRTTIGRMDSALKDLRQFGFTLVTGLLTAGGLVGSATTSSTEPDAVAVTAAIVLVLVLGLFAVDMYHQVLLGSAVERALDIEASTNPAVRVTANLALGAYKSRSVFTIPLIYGLFVATSAAMAWIFNGVHNGWVTWVIAPAVFVLMFLYWLFAVLGAGKLHTFKPDPPRHWVVDPPDPPLGPKKP
jgi:hypothetical protein